MKPDKVKANHLQATTAECTLLSTTSLTTEVADFITLEAFDGSTGTSSGITLASRPSGDVTTPDSGGVLFVRDDDIPCVRDASGNDITLLNNALADVSLDADGGDATNLDSIVMNAQTTPTASAGTGTLFVQNTTPTTIGFVDDTGTLSPLPSSPSLATTLAVGNSVGTTSIDSNLQEVQNVGNLSVPSANGIRISHSDRPTAAVTSDVKIAIGNVADPRGGDGDVVIGYNAYQDQNTSMSIMGIAGSGNNIGADQAGDSSGSVAIGFDTELIGTTFAIPGGVIGHRCVTNQWWSASVGHDNYNNTATRNGFNIGHGNSSLHRTAKNFGFDNASIGEYGLCVGSNNNAGTSCTAIGQNLTTFGNRIVAFNSFKIVPGEVTTTGTGIQLIINVPGPTDIVASCDLIVSEYNEVTGQGAAHFARRFQYNEVGTPSIDSFSVTSTDPDALGSTVSVTAASSRLNIFVTPGSTDSTLFTVYLTIRDNL